MASDDRFTVSKSELEMDLEIGETGTLMVPVEVVSIDKENYFVRKIGKITPEGEFKPETVKDMRERIGVVEDVEEPLNKQDEE
jgi:hypothetical protein